MLTKDTLTKDNPRQIQPEKPAAISIAVRTPGYLAPTGQKVDDFVEALLRRIAEADVRFDCGVPVFRHRPDAPVLTVQNIDRIELRLTAQLFS